MVMEKRCYKCRLWKPVEEFHRRKSDPKGYRGECKKCSRIISIEYFKKHPEASKKGDLKYRLTHKFGLTIEEYNKIGEQYNWSCFICKMPQSECNTNLAIDHDHSDGRIRGLLCRRCNHGLGFFKDDISLLEEAVRYLRCEDVGYKGLYGGLGAHDIHDRKRLKKSQKILDHMGSEELAANLFRTTQAEAKIRREEVRGQGNASLAHLQVGQRVRATIQSLGGTMPEELTTSDAIGKAQTRIKKSKEKKVLGEKKRILSD